MHGMHGKQFDRYLCEFMYRYNIIMLKEAKTLFFRVNEGHEKVLSSRMNGYLTQLHFISK